MGNKKIEVNVAALEALAGTSPLDDLAKFEGQDTAFTGELAEAMNNLAKEERANKVKAAAAEIMKLVQFSDVVTSDTVRHIRGLRREAEELTQKLAKIAMARAYGMETKNFLPLLSIMSGDGKHEVPKGWKAAQPKVGGRKS